MNERTAIGTPTNNTSMENVMRNSVLATLIAGFWSLMSGLVLVTTLQALLLV